MAMVLSSFNLMVNFRSCYSLRFGDTEIRICSIAEPRRRLDKQNSYCGDGQAYLFYSPVRQCLDMVVVGIMHPHQLASSNTLARYTAAATIHVTQPNCTPGI